MINLERQQNETELKNKLNLLAGHIKEEAKSGLKNYGQFRPGEVGSPTFRYKFNEAEKEAVYEVEENSVFYDEVRRYVINSKGEIRKEGYVEAPGRKITYTKEECYLNEGEFKAEPLQVSSHELDILAKLILSPLENVRELDFLAHLPN